MRRRLPSPSVFDFETALAKTIANAAQAPYYRRVFGEAPHPIRTLADLAHLPILDKRTAIAHQEALVVGPRPPGLGVVSSGTTRADVDLRPLYVHHSAAEQAAQERLRPSGRGDSLFPGWTLVVQSVTHGISDPTRQGELYAPWMHDRNALYMIEQLLERPQPDGYSVSAMRITTGALKVFTTWLRERDRSPGRFAVRLIGTHSFRLTPFWRALVGESFNARIFDNYSLSEFMTPATECPACGLLHFGWPPIAYEVVDLVSGKQRERGAGRLLLTGLYPFAQKMPLVRYDTGDVIELGGRCRATGLVGLRFLGRARRGVVFDTGGEGVFLLAPSLVQDILEAMPETARNPHPCVTLGIIKSQEVGLPRWTAHLVAAAPPALPVARLEFELRFDPLVYRERAVALERRVARALLAAEAPLSSLVRERRLRLTVKAVRQGDLTPPPDKYD